MLFNPLRPLSHMARQMPAALAPVRQGATMWLEATVIALSALALGLWLSHDNPFQIRGEFPWIWLAPVLVSLRYGVGPGIFSSLVLMVAWLLGGRPGVNPGSFPEQYFLGGVILVMLSGQFSASWGARLRRAEESSRYLDERLNRITFRHLLLRLSHDQLQQQILAKPVTLRDALTDLRNLTFIPGPVRMPAAQSLLSLLTQYCQLESAAIFCSASEGRGYVQSCAVGYPPDLDPADPLLAYALEHQALSHLLADGLDDQSLPSPFLVVAPIMASDGAVLGMLAIDHMPFLALNEENLQMIAVLLGYYADCVVESEGTRQFLEHFPEAPQDFAAEFARVLSLHRKHGIESHVVVLTFANDEDGRQAITHHELIRRSLDIVWRREAGAEIILTNLMPLATEEAVQEYLLRVDARMKESMGARYDERNLAPRLISLADNDPMGSLLRATKGVAP